LSITAWRITKRRHVKNAFTGSGARKFGGRWNSPGTSIVYTAETQSLAVLEMLVHLEQPDLLQRYVLIGITIDPAFIETLDNSRLPRNWRTAPPSIALRSLGDEWAANQTSVALRVPSVLVPSENNFLLNPAHPDINKLSVGEPVTFAFDERLAL
jgi:RES domain-containing protein